MVRQIDALNLGKELLKTHNLVDWSLTFNKSTSRLGQCWHFQKTIVLSLMHLNTASLPEMRDTILHEIAHALIGPDGNSHGEKWKQKALEIGCTSEVCGEMNSSLARRIEKSEVLEIQKIEPLGKKCPICNTSAEIVSQTTFPDGKTFYKLKCSHVVSRFSGTDFSDWE